MTETSTAQTKLVVLSPFRVTPSVLFNFKNVQSSKHRHEDLLAQMQRFRGSVYYEDGAIPAHELSKDGRHRLSIDERSWHVLALNSKNEVCACVRYLPESAGTKFDDLWIRESAISQCPSWGGLFRRAIEQERERARQKRFDFAEVGGWAVAEDRRWTPDPLRMILAVCGLARIMGGCIGVATATVRHGSAVILRRIGLASMSANGVQLPPYYDPHYGCEMEALRFDTDFPNPKYKKWIEELRLDLQTAPLVCRINSATEWAMPLPQLAKPRITPPFRPSLIGQMAS